MGLRETIAYNKNLITGITKKLKKYKDTDAPMINVATIQLFNAETGELEYEAKAENLINNIISKFAYMDYYYWRIRGSIAPTTSKYSSPFQTIVLTDYSGAEDPSITLVKGNVIGSADKTTAYSGTSTTLGTINLAETKLDTTSNGVLHFVFDFPTNACNGTFQTIWWAATNINQIVNMATVSPTDWAVLIAHKNGVASFWNIATGGNILSYNFDLTGSTKIYPTGTFSLGGSTPIGGECDGNFVYIVDMVLGGHNISKFSADMTTFISKIAIPAIIPASYGTMLDVAELNGTLYVVTTNLYIVPLNMSTGVWGTGVDLKPKLGYPSNATCTYAGISSNGIDKFFVGFNYNVSARGVFTLDASFNVLELRKITTDYVTKITYDRINNVLYYVTYYSYTYLYKTIVEMTSPGAQNLLATSVTKTNTQTMKIQYDFNIQKVL